MSDQQTLTTFIYVIKSLFQDKSVAIFDLELNVLYASKSYYDFFNLEEIANKPVVEIEKIDKNIAKLVSEFRLKLTNIVIANKKSYIGFFFLQIAKNKGCEIFKATVFPIINSENNQVVGVYIEVHPVFNNREAFTKMLELITEQKNIGTHINGQDMARVRLLTPREKIVIFMIMLGRNHKEIAEILSKVYGKPVLVNSVSAMVSKQIYPKLNVYGTSQLINFGIKLGFFYNLPAELIIHLPQIFYVIPFEQFNRRLRIYDTKY